MLRPCTPGRFQRIRSDSLRRNLSGNLLCDVCKRARLCIVRDVDTSTFPSKDMSGLPMRRFSSCLNAHDVAEMVGIHTQSAKGETVVLSTGPLSCPQAGLLARKFEASKWNTLSRPSNDEIFIAMIDPSVLKDQQDVADDALEIILQFKIQAIIPASGILCSQSGDHANPPAEYSSQELP